MAIEKIVMPKLGESVTEGTITSWLVNEGDQVKKYDPIAEVMTDKVTAEIPSSYTGTITALIVEEGNTVDVGSLIAHIEAEGGGSEVSNAGNDLEEKKTIDTIADSDNVQTEKTKIVNSSQIKQQAQSSGMRYSPAVLRLTNEHGLQLEEIEGTGRGGRITRKDVLHYIDNGPSRQAVEAKHDTGSLQTKSPSYDERTDDIVIPVSGVRKAIAQNMVRSSTEIPHAWMTVEVDVTDLVTYRNSIKDTFKTREGYSITYFAFFVQAVAQALKEYPMLNSTWQEDKIIQHKDVNISIAVAAEDQLYVPVIQQANEKSLSGIAKEITNLAQKARAGKLTMDDMEGGTFTVNNTGTFGSISSMGIINHPQAAILQVESIVKRPVIINDMFAARDIVNLSLSLDHRILDGLICGQFLQRVKQLLENVNGETTTI